MRVVVVGAGPAGARCAETLATHAEVTLIGSEPGQPYNRVALSQYLAGDISVADLVTHDGVRLARLGVRHLPATRVVAIDRAASEVVTQDGGRIGYDRLVLATGAQAVRLGMPGNTLPGVVLYRTLDDVEQMLAATGCAVVIGGGLLGLEAAAGLAKRGLRVTVVHAVGRLMERQLDDGAAGLLARHFARLGVTLELAASTAGVVGTDRVTGVALADGRVLPADLVVMAVGIRPETALAAAAGLEVARGIVVDDAMRSSDAAIFAVGECAQHNGACCGLVAPALAQADIAAAVIAGGQARYVPVADATVLKIGGAGVWSGGDITAADADSIVLDDAEDGCYRRFLLRDGMLVGAMLYGETVDAPWYQGLITSGEKLSFPRAMLAFGPRHLTLEAAQ
jgi:nitrite reductase (NADH) large subunit